MSVKDKLLLNFNKYIEENQNNIDKLEIINTIVKSMDKYVNKYKKHLDQKEKYINDINKTVANFFIENKNLYWYIKQYNGFYEYIDGKFELINSDKILVTISQYIPNELYKNKSIIQKMIIDKIKKNHLFKNINLP